MVGASHASGDASAIPDQHGYLAGARRVAELDSRQVESI
jgi:hypothetical protein